MKNYKKITIAVIALAAVGISVYDIFPAVNKSEGDTISETLLGSAKKVPIVAVVWGILTGHLFWPQRERD